MSDVPAITKASAHDIDIMSRTVYGEARGETWLGKVQVAIVILNRVKADLWNDGKPDWWGEGIAEVCLKPHQFTCWTPGDPNLPKLKAVTLDDVDFQECMAATLQVILGLANGVALDWTGTHYLMVGTHADWAAGKEHDFVIGKHAFYSGIN